MPIGSGTLHPRQSTFERQQAKHLLTELELAGRLAERPPVAVACVLKAIAAGLYGGIDAGLGVEEESSRLLAQTSDAREGIIAFLEKRQPVFKGE